MQGTQLARGGMYIEKGIATFFGAGYFPWGPGTAGSLVSILLWSSMFCTGWVFGHPLLFQTSIILVFILAGTWATSRLEPIWGKDPSKIVIDEAVGMWITLLFVPCNWTYILAAFILFRFFDITKPLGIRKTEAYFGAFGVILDDIVAGIYAWICMMIILYFKCLG